MKIIGNLTITRDNAAQYSALTSIGGALFINADAKLDALTSVGGALVIYADAKLNAPALTSVGGDLVIHAGAKLDAPALTSVGGALSIHADATLDAPALYAPGYSAFAVIDGIASVELSRRVVGEITILRCSPARIVLGKLVGDKFYVARQGDQAAHGKTPGDAVRDLKAKMQASDVSAWRNIPLTTRKTTKQWIAAYRAITGACQFGVDRFLSELPPRKSYTLAEVLEITSQAYGGERFACVTHPAGTDN